MVTTTHRIAPRPRAYVRVSGPEAAEYLERMLSNEVASLQSGESCNALLLTAKARVIAPVRVLRRADDDFLLLTEPELGEPVRVTLLRSRFAAKAEIEPEEHTSTLVLGGQGGIPTFDYGEPAVELLDTEVAGDRISAEELERMRIETGTPAWGTEIDDRVLPAEAGLEASHISFTKGCYPGQEPIARQHHRGRVNRRLRVLALENGSAAAQGAAIRLDGKAVGWVTSAVPGVALGYVRVEVPEDAEFEIEGVFARLHFPSPRP